MKPHITLASKHMVHFHSFLGTVPKVVFGSTTLEEDLCTFAHLTHQLFMNNSDATKVCSQNCTSVIVFYQKKKKKSYFAKGSRCNLGYYLLSIFLSPQPSNEKFKRKHPREQEV